MAIPSVARALVLLLATAFAGAALLAVAAEAEARTVWLCKPGKAENPCLGSLETTHYSSSGSSHVTNPRNARRPRIDCFYVYPTVSEQMGPNSDREVEPQQEAIAEYQAARFSQRCRVFAPMYRQLTIGHLVSGAETTPEQAALAYGDVAAAWQSYLEIM